MPPVPGDMPDRPAPGCALRLAREAGVDLRALQPVVEAVFPAPDRPPGWFARKLAREAADPAWTALAFGPGDAVVGYFLLGPGERIAHSSGLGVLPAFRGLGLGRALIDRSAQVVRDLGIAVIGALAEPPVRGFYESAGFRQVGEHHSLLARACGPVDLDLGAHPPRPWAAPGRQIAGWRADTWSRTPSDVAATVVLRGGAATVHLSREGRAILVQRVCVDEASPTDLIATTHAALDELRRHFADGTPLLLYGCTTAGARVSKTVSCVTASLLRTGPWRTVQTACEMERGV